MVETRKPRAVRHGITRVSSVVLPAPLQPAMPMTFMRAAYQTGVMPSAAICARTAGSASALRNAATAGRSRRASDQQEIVILRRELEGSRARTSRPPDGSPRPSRRDPARPPPRPRCASAAGCRSRPDARRRASWSIRMRVPAPALRLTMMQSRSASAAFSASCALLPSKRASPARNTMPCMRCQPRTSARPSFAIVLVIDAGLPGPSDGSARDRIRRAAPPRRRPCCRSRSCAPKCPAPRARRAPHRARRNGCPRSPGRARAPARSA